MVIINWATAKYEGLGKEIAMTATVLMNNRPGDSMMSFVMPKEFTLPPPKKQQPRIW